MNLTKRKLTIIILHLSLLLLFNCSTKPKERMTITINNQTGQTICEVYLKGNGTEDWGNNLLTSNLYHGLSRTIYMPDEYTGGRYDFLSIDSHGTSTTRTYTLLFGKNSLTIRIGDTEKLKVEITNITGRMLGSIRVRNASPIEESWIDVDSDSRHANNSTRVYLLPNIGSQQFQPGIYDFQIRLRDNDAYFIKRNVIIMSDVSLTFTYEDYDGIALYIINEIHIQEIGAANMNIRVSTEVEWRDAGNLIINTYNAPTIRYLNRSFAAGVYDIQLNPHQSWGCTFIKRNIPLFVGSNQITITTNDSESNIIMDMSNNTGMDLDKFYIKNNNSTDWSKINLYWNNANTKQIAVLPYSSLPGNYDIQWLGNYGEGFLQSNVSLSFGGNPTMVFTNSDTAQNQQIGITIINNTGAIMPRVYYGTNNDHYYLIDIDNNQTRNIYLPLGYTDGHYTIRLTDGTSYTSGMRFTKRNAYLVVGSNTLVFTQADVGD